MNKDTAKEKETDKVWYYYWTLVHDKSQSWGEERITASKRPPLYRFKKEVMRFSGFEPWEEKYLIIEGVIKFKDEKEYFEKHDSQYAMEAFLRRVGQ